MYSYPPTRLNTSFEEDVSRNRRLVYTEFICVESTLKYVPGTIQYIAKSVKFLAQGNNGLQPDWG